MKHDRFAMSLDVAVVVLCALSVPWWAQLRGITIWVVLLIHGFWRALAMTVLLTVIFFLTHVLLRGTCKAQDKANWACGLLRDGFLLSNIFFKENKVYVWISKQLRAVIKMICSLEKGNKFVFSDKEGWNWNHTTVSNTFQNHSLLQQHWM